MFMNCYTYNQSGEDVVKMGQELEKAFLTKLAHMPAHEVEIPAKMTKGGKIGKRGPGRPPGTGTATGRPHSTHSAQTILTRLLSNKTNFSQE